MNLSWLKDLLQGLAVFGGGLASLIAPFVTLRRQIVGKEAIVVREEGPYALIRVNGGTWHALAEDGSRLTKGERVVVRAVKGLQLAIVWRSSGQDAAVMRETLGGSR